MVGTSEDSRFQIQTHLHYHKWAQSAFTSDLLRSSRWLLGASPRNAKESVKQILTVTAEAQSDFLRNYIAHFSSKAAKCRASSRGKIRASLQEWDRLVDYACVMRSVHLEAARALAEHPKDKIDHVLALVDQAFMARPIVGAVNLCWKIVHVKITQNHIIKKTWIIICFSLAPVTCRDYMSEIQSCLEVSLPNWNIKHLSLWTEIVTPELMGTVEATDVDMEAVEEATAQAQYSEVCSKIAFLSWTSSFDRLLILKIYLTQFNVNPDTYKKHKWFQDGNSFTWSKPNWGWMNPFGCATKLLSTRDPPENTFSRSLTHERRTQSARGILASILLKYPHLIIPLYCIYHMFPVYIMFICIN